MIALPSSFFLSNELLISAFKATIITAICCTIAQIVVYTTLVRHRQAKASDEKLHCLKTSHQATNALMNVVFGLCGTYICLTFHFQNPDEPILLASTNYYQDNIAHHVLGYESFTFIVLAAMQVGYNLWNLPVGLFLVNEPLTMIFHHIFVIFTCSYSGYTSYGSRIHVPFFLGMYEISSVPLAYVNYLRDYKDWVKANKNIQVVQDVCKLLFALLFLGIRIILGSPHIHNIISATYWALTTLEIGSDGFPFLGAMWMGFALLSHCGLAALQYYWAFLIIKGLYRMAAPLKSKAL
mmetsp:Transcript_9988/g.11457  ORF Transcript_9988/g.11457 Transcript_9988/m.11457 type:complete len:295 (-) Transcript_9988:123-1007(-)|eukprot:CAMPEP_0194362918 /NCGR_PEP_ID=MMETSP0174-20130528/10801_1 /TAXON_ID=216777 /ORGANISM="Proboscia alata, Strain PI-D3" /LENGTH=294 /DNA_ID=CAMNT_0039136153 /DNA_START=40 /DNA_END=924 /DNA_ORIENTATION=-